MYPQKVANKFKAILSMKKGWMLSDFWERQKMVRLITHLIRSQKGTTSIEYALVASLIFLVIVAAVSELGGGVTRLFQLAADGFPR